MRTVAFVCLFMICMLGKAQGNLQFNQVITYTGTGTGSHSYISPSWIVPNNRVWKIEAATASVSSSSSSSSVQMNSGNGLCSFKLMSAGVYSSFSPFPIWLKAGDEILLQASGGCCSILSFNYGISIIEFNIVP